MLTKVISGGQTGADQIGLEVAKSLGITTGGTAPRGYRTELGTNLDLRDIYGLSESSSSSYTPRTMQNILNSDMTVIYGDITSPGSRQTETLCKVNHRSYLTNPLPNRLARFILENNISTLNVAGNRGSKLTPAKQAEIRALITDSLKLILNPTT